MFSSSAKSWDVFCGYTLIMALSLLPSLIERCLQSSSFSRFLSQLQNLWNQCWSDDPWSYHLVDIVSSFCFILSLPDNKPDWIYILHLYFWQPKINKKHWKQNHKWTEQNSCFKMVYSWKTPPATVNSALENPGSLIMARIICCNRQVTLLFKNEKHDSMEVSGMGFLFKVQVHNQIIWKFTNR